MTPYLMQLHVPMNGETHPEEHILQLGTNGETLISAHCLGTFFGHASYYQPPHHSWDAQTEQPNLILPLYGLHRALGSSPVPSFTGTVAGGFTPHSHHNLNQQQPPHYQTNFLSQLKKMLFLGASPWGGCKPHQCTPVEIFNAENL